MFGTQPRHLRNCLLFFLVLCYCYAACAAPPIGPNEGRPLVRWQDASQVVGRTALVCGVVARVGHAKRVHFLNFDVQRRDVFSVVIFQPSLGNFERPLEELYEGRPIRVRGLVSLYAGVPQIQVNSPDQIEVLAAMPEIPPLAKPAELEIGDEITVATFNVRNLFDEVDDPYYADENTPAKPREELEKVASAIRRLDADLLALEEVENRGYLERFVEVFLSDAGYRHIVHFEGNDTRGIDVCLLSRIPVGAVTSHRHLQLSEDSLQRFSRDLLSVRIEPRGRQPLEVWVLHLKSNSGGREFAEPTRLTEARAVRRLLDERLQSDPHAAIIVCGDFNDTADSATLKSIAGNGTSALQSDWSSIPMERQITYNLEPHRSMIDFILWSPALAARYVPGSYAIAPGELSDLGSDHRPVSARFSIRNEH